MKTIDNLISDVQGFINWAQSGGEQKAGLPKNSATTFLSECSKSASLLVVIKTELAKFKTYWNSLSSNQTVNASGSELLAVLKNLDSHLVNTLTAGASMQAHLRSFESLILNKKTSSDAQLIQVKLKLQNAKALAAKFSAEMQAAINRSDKQKANQSWFQWMQNQNSADYAFSEAQSLNSELSNCAEIIKAIKQINDHITTYRNKLTSVDADLEQAVYNEQKAIATTSERLSDYYKRQVGGEINSLLTILG